MTDALGSGVGSHVSRVWDYFSDWVMHCEPERGIRLYAGASASGGTAATDTDLNVTSAILGWSPNLGFI